MKSSRRLTPRTGVASIHYPDPPTVLQRQAQHGQCGGIQFVVVNVNEIGETCTPLCHCLPALQQQATDLVHQGCPLGDQPIPNTVESLDIQMILAFGCHETHRWPSRRLDNGLGIPLVVLLRLHVWAHIFRRH